MSRLVDDYMRSLSAREAEIIRLEAQQRRVQRQIECFSARDRLSREQVHGRAVR